jgi:hypothetical protein
MFAVVSNVRERATLDRLIQDNATGAAKWVTKPLRAGE